MIKDFMKKHVLTIIKALSLFGLLDASYLAYGRYMHVDLPCSITNGGCATVAASPYAVMFGMPLAYLGVIFYVSIFVLAMLYSYSKHVRIKQLLLIAIIFGALDSLYFLYIQGFVIGAFCIYCVLSALTTFVLLLPAYLLYVRKIK